MCEVVPYFNPINIKTMNIKQMHIGIDLGLRLQNSNQFNKLMKEEKDFILNKAIISVVKDAIPTEADQLNVVGDDVIKEQYNVLDTVLTEKDYVEFVHGDKYIEVTLPRFMDQLIQDGLLYVDNKYKIVTPGTTDLTDFGCAVNVPDKEFEYTPDDVIWVADGGGFNFNIILGYVYKILRTDGTLFTNNGAPSNDVGTIFTCTSTETFTSASMKETRLQIIAGLPAWDNATSVRVVKNLDVFEIVRSTSLVYTNCTFNIGMIRKGYYYKVVQGGTIVGLTAFGSAYDVVEAGYIFLCTKDGAPAWASSGVRLSELMLSVNRLPAMKDVDNAISHPIGTLVSSPISTRLGGKLRVFHDNKFDIHRINLVYIRRPIAVDSITGINCDLNEAIHDHIVDRAVSYVAATHGAPTYQALKNEENQNK